MLPLGTQLKRIVAVFFSILATPLLQTEDRTILNLATWWPISPVWNYKDEIGLLVFMQDNFSSADFSKVFFLKNILSGQSVKQFGPDQDRCSVGPDLAEVLSR